MGDLTENFSRDEFACKCGCGYDSIKMEVVNKLQHMREEKGDSMPITSGCRCPIHNQRVGGSSQSEHMTGEGVDLAVYSSHNAYILMRAAFNAGFQRIGFGKNKSGNLIMHVGISTALPTPRLWGY
jgi:hypothetical protein